MRLYIWATRISGIPITGFGLFVLAARTVFLAARKSWILELLAFDE
jgi:hypothetical protein